MKHWKGILAIIVSLGLALALLPLSITGASGTVTVGIDAPAKVDPGSSFVANVTVDSVTDFNACGFDVIYTKTIITVTDVTGGEIDGHAILVDEWHYVPASSPGDTGRIRVLALVPGAPVPGVTGTGRIAQIHFNVVGSPGQASAIHLEEVGMYDYLANKIATTTVDDSVSVAIPPPEITTTALPEGRVGYVYTATLAATGGKTPYKWGATGLPAGLTCSTAGVISGTPTASGNFSVTANVTDSSSPPNIVSKVLSLKVYAALEITTASPLPEAKVGDAYTATLVATGGKAPYTWTATGLPAGLTCSAAGVISGTPTASGQFSVRATVTDSFSPPKIVSKGLSLKVYPALGITTASPLPEGKVGQAYRATTLVATGGKTPYTWMATGLPAGLTCSAAGVISGTPTAGGQFSVNATVTDSFSPPNIVSKVLSLYVYAALEIATTSLPEGKVGYAYTATLVATGGRAPYTWKATGLPAGLTCSAAGVISGTPTASGDFSVTANVTDSSSPPNTVKKTNLTLFVCILGDANGDGVVDTGDITKLKRIYFGLDAPTPCADVNGDEIIDTGDITAIKIIYFS
ncbi:MAG: putative Ig domain-containing protein [Dehalococcoidia bacterium]